MAAVTAAVVIPKIVLCLIVRTSHCEFPECKCVPPGVLVRANRESSRTHQSPAGRLQRSTGLFAGQTKMTSSFRQAYRSRVDDTAECRDVAKGPSDCLATAR